MMPISLDITRRNILAGAASIGAPSILHPPRASAAEAIDRRRYTVDTGLRLFRKAEREMCPLAPIKRDSHSLGGVVEWSKN